MPLCQLDKERRRKGGVPTQHYTASMKTGRSVPVPVKYHDEIATPVGVVRLSDVPLKAQGFIPSARMLLTPYYTDRSEFTFSRRYNKTVRW